MENAKNSLQEQQEKDERIDRNDETSVGDDSLGENTEITPLGEELEKDEDNNSVNDGKAADNPAPEDDAQLDIETVSP